MSSKLFARSREKQTAYKEDKVIKQICLHVDFVRLCDTKTKLPRKGIKVSINTIQQCLQEATMRLT